MSWQITLSSAEGLIQEERGERSILVIMVSSMRQASWIICKATTFSVNGRFEGHSFYRLLKKCPISWPGGCRLSTWSILGILGSQKNDPVLLPSVGPFSKKNSDICTQSGVFSPGMGTAQKVIGWSYKNWKEIRSWGVTKYFLVHSKRLIHLEIVCVYFWIFSI